MNPKIGFLVDGWDTRLLGCSYFNNSAFKLDGITIVRHKRGRLLVTDGAFVKTTPHYTVYDGCGEVEWFNMMYSGFGPGENCPGALTFKKKSATDQPALKLAECHFRDGLLLRGVIGKSSVWLTPRTRLAYCMRPSAFGG